MLNIPVLLLKQPSKCRENTIMKPLVQLICVFLWKTPYNGRKSDSRKWCITNNQSLQYSQGDGKHKQLVGNRKVLVHLDCRNDYTKPSSVNKDKRRSEKIKKEENNIYPKRFRSDTLNFKTIYLFFFCEKSLSLTKKK